MNAFVRQIAVLSVLWSLCELLLPQGRQRRAVRMTVSLLVMAALVSALSGLLGSAAVFQWPDRAVVALAAPEEGYGRTALQAVANQAQRLCQRVAEKAGYRATAVVALREDGSLEKIELTLALREGAPPLLEPQEVAQRLARLLETEEDRVRILPGDGGGGP